MSFFDQEMKSMLDVFLLETSQLLEQLDVILLSAEQRGSLTAEEINGIFRVMHTSKSSSAMMGLQDLSDWPINWKICLIFFGKMRIGYRR